MKNGKAIWRIVKVYAGWHLGLFDLMGTEPWRNFADGYDMSSGQFRGNADLREKQRSSQDMILYSSDMRSWTVWYCGCVFSICDLWITLQSQRIEAGIHKWIIIWSANFILILIQIGQWEVLGIYCRTQRTGFIWDNYYEKSGSMNTNWICSSRRCESETEVISIADLYIVTYTFQKH